MVNVCSISVFSSTVDCNILGEGNNEDDDLRILELLLVEVDVESASAKLFAPLQYQYHHGEGADSVLVLNLQGLNFSVLSSTMLQKDLQMPHHAWLLYVMEADAIWGTAIFSLFYSPFSIECCIPF